MEKYICFFFFSHFLYTLPTLKQKSVNNFVCYGNRWRGLWACEQALHMLHLVDIDLELSRARGSRKETREQRGFSHGSLLWSFKLESFDRRSPLPTNPSFSPYPSPNPRLILTSQSVQNVGLVNRPVPAVQILRKAQRKSSISSYSSPISELLEQVML